MKQEAELWKRLISHLHRGGQWAYYWQLPEKKSSWHPVGRNGTIPKGDAIYFGVHPTKQNRGESKRARDEDICAVNCIYSEFDSKDFGGDDAGSKVKALEHIKALPLPPSVVIDSGGGYHCYWLLDETFNIQTRDDLTCIKQVQKRWVDFVGGDQGAKDLARILRVPGTLNQKYKPARRVVFLEATFDLYNLKQLEAISTAPIPTPLANENGKAATRTANAYAQAALDSEIAELRGALEGTRNDRLNKAAYALGQLVGAGALNINEVEIQLLDASIATGLSKEEAQRTIQSGLTAGARTPRQIPTNGTQTVAKNQAVQDDAAPTPNEVERSKLDNVLLSEGADDEGNAQCVAKLHGDSFCYSQAYGWLHYNGQYWDREVAEAVLERAIVRVLKDRREAAVRAEKEPVITAAKPSARHMRDAKTLLQSIVIASVGEFDNDPNVLNCANGVLDLRSGQLIAHEASQRFTYCLPVEYKPDADASMWLNFLATVVGGGHDVIDYVQIAAGYTATGHTREECMFYVYGPTRSGKGTFMETLATLLGPRLSKQVDFTTFTAKRVDDSNQADLADLKPCRMIAASESDKYQSLNAAKIKQLTGGDDIRCAFKFKDHFTYRPQYKIWLFSNNSVNVDVDDEAAWYRVRVIEFPTSYKDREDKTLKQRMKHLEVLSGVLTWIVQGALRWYATPNGLAIPAAVQEATASHRAKNDLIQQWISECCVLASDVWAPNEILYGSYSEWCKSNGLQPKQQRGLSLALKGKGLRVGLQKWHAGINLTGVEGIQVKSSTQNNS